MESAGLELIYGVGRFLAHPLPYILLLVMVFLGFRRVRRERKMFQLKFRPELADLWPALLPAIAAGLLLSIVVLFVGITVSPAFLWLISILTVVLLVGGPRFVSPANILGGAVLVGMALPYAADLLQLSLPPAWRFTEQPEVFISAVLLLGGMMIVEGLLVARAHRGASPLRMKSPRGKPIGGYEVKHLFPVPVFVFIPGGMIEPFGWWPVLPIGAEGLGIMLFPVAVGFSQKVYRMLPKQACNVQGARIIAAGLLVTGLSITAFYEPLFIVIAAVAAVVLRESVYAVEALREAKAAPLFSPRDQGLLVLGVLENSPAEKMDLKPGEIIVKANGFQTNAPADLYQGIQKNSAYCRLDVVGYDGEVRKAESALYADEHHEIGVLLLRERSTEIEVSAYPW
ncbi:hypothetical protein B0H94_11333 [Salsuginibacillus halophilus]|uniref:PDZ domain-containing protein n=1 Tax=Salsuginibacillus halophilus TaxID=517424 RepID=A0A2P8H938_9BACI|nr:PDZ domain-containing protein [Salsuginibacillus halophilus]PSL42747.1 hypothetical protein B0H94_11333 [Salsuginibacillus halophilus]